MDFKFSISVWFLQIICHFLAAFMYIYIGFKLRDTEFFGVIEFIVISLAIALTTIGTSIGASL